MRILPRFDRRLPQAAMTALGIGPGERVIAWGSSTQRDGTAVLTAATDRALYIQALGERLPWDQISRATWTEPELTVTASDDHGRSRPPIRVRIDDARDLPPAVHDRVTTSVVVSERVDLGEGRKALLVARRGDGGIRWSVVFDAGLDPSDASLRAAADEALARLRDSLGI